MTTLVTAETTASAVPVQVSRRRGYAGYVLRKFLGACGSLAFVLVLNFFLSMRRGAVAGPNPWRANTLEWQTASPPPHENFTGRIPTVYRGPYEYSVPGHGSDYLPQNEPGGLVALAAQTKQCRRVPRGQAERPVSEAIAVRHRR